MSSGRAGFSLVELLIGMAFLALFAAMVQSSCSALLRGVRILEVASEAQETARLGVQLIVADAREAGFSPGGALPDGIRRASRTIVGIARDLNGDGDVDDAQERVTYSYAPDRRALLRAQGDAAPQPLIDGLDDDGLALTYVDAQGMPLDPGTAELDSNQLARIRRIAVRVRIALPSPDPASRAPLRAEERATAMLRNAGL
jgi:type II secretory pathway component PulJ